MRKVANSWTVSMDTLEQGPFHLICGMVRGRDRTESKPPRINGARARVPARSFAISRRLAPRRARFPEPEPSEAGDRSKAWDDAQDWNRTNPATRSVLRQGDWF